jgi:imidazole glycerol-phosphate synthase subunit HisH
MEKNVLILDYGMGNIFSVKNALKYLGAKVKISSNPSDMIEYNHIILPGVGSFSKAMEKIKYLKMDIGIKNSAKKKKNIFGICLGFQLLCNTSTEGGLKKGLGLIEDDIIKMDFNFGKVPHVGFNNIKIIKHNKLLDGIKEDADFYFNHSYFLKNNNQNFVSSTCINNNDFVSSYCKDNIYGTQFHPEKSQSNGLIILKNFLNN